MAVRQTETDRQKDRGKTMYPKFLVAGALKIVTIEKKSYLLNTLSMSIDSVLQ